MQIGLTADGSYPKWAWKSFFPPQTIEQMFLPHFKANSVLTVPVSTWNNVTDFWGLSLDFLWC